MSQLLVSRRKHISAKKRCQSPSLIISPRCLGGMCVIGKNSSTVSAVFLLLVHMANCPSRNNKNLFLNSNAFFDAKTSVHVDLRVGRYTHLVILHASRKKCSCFLFGLCMAYKAVHGPINGPINGQGVSQQDESTVYLFVRISYLIYHSRSS